MTTNCVFPPELDDKQLLAYLDDRKSNPDTADHLKKCPYCRERAETLDHFQKSLTTHLYRATCPSPMELGEFHMRLSPAPERLIIAQHVRECPYCVRELSELERFLSDQSPQASPLEPIKVLIARLISGEAEPAVRGEVQTAQVFQVDEIVVSLETQWTPKGEVSLRGLIAADNQEQWTGATVELQQDYLTSLISYVDDLGSFSFTETVPGPTQVIITSLTGIAVQTEKVNIST